MENPYALTDSRLSLLLAFLALVLHVSAQDDASRSDADTYNIIVLQTDTLPSLNMARTGHVTLYLDGELTVLGGHTDGFVPTATAEYYSDGKWHTVPLVYPHDDATIIELRSGKVFLSGGHKEPLGIGQLYSAEIYDPATHTSHGFGCMECKRAYANAIEMADGQIVISGNWFADDAVEIFEDVYDPQNTNAVKVKDVSVQRARPYILRISDDDAIIFGSLSTKAEDIDSSIVDRLNGTSYHEPFLDTWHPIRTINVQRNNSQFVGDTASGRYEWLLPVQNYETGRVAIAQVAATDTEGAKPAFTLLPTQQQVPDSIYGKPIIYTSLLCDRDRSIAYLIGNDDEARIYVVSIPYGNEAPASLTVYITAPQPINAADTTPILTPEGDLLFTGGSMLNNFYPTRTVIRLPLGYASVVAVIHSESRGGLWWLWILLASILVSAIVATVIAKRKCRMHASPESEATGPDPEPACDPTESEAAEDVQLDKNLPKIDIPVDLFNRIEQLMETEQLYLDANLRASDVAARVGSNTTYVSAAINSQRGCSFTQYLTAYRIAYAQELMRQNPNDKISNISSLSGFSTDSTFFRAFRSITGITPKEWLSTIRENPQQ